MKAKAVIFDFDDTLVKTYDIKVKHWQAVAKDSYGIDLSEATVREHWGKPYTDLHGIFFQNSDTLENMVNAKLAREHEFPLVLQPGALDAVTRLHEAGVLLSILTATSNRVVHADLERLGFNLADFVFIQTMEDTTVHKPDPAVFKPMLARLAQAGIKQNITYIGDSLADYRAATGAGLDFVAVTTGHVTAPQFIKAGVKRVIPSLEEFSF